MRRSKKQGKSEKPGDLRTEEKLKALALMTSPAYHYWWTCEDARPETVVTTVASVASTPACRPQAASLVMVTELRTPPSSEARGYASLRVRLNIGP